MSDFLDFSNKFEALSFDLAYKIRVTFLVTLKCMFYRFKLS